MSRKKKPSELFDGWQLAEECRAATAESVSPVGYPEGREDHLLTGHETILLVDDDKIIIDVARDMLQILGYRVIATQHGREAVDIYARQTRDINLVIQDMVMPGMNGADVFQALKKINPKVKVILASGYVMNKQIAAVMEQGCRAFMSKPFRLEELSVKVREVLDSP